MIWLFTLHKHYMEHVLLRFLAYGPPHPGNLFGGPGQIPLASLQDNSKEEEEEAEQHVEHQI